MDSKNNSAPFWPNFSHLEEPLFLSIIFREEQPTIPGFNFLILYFLYFYILETNRLSKLKSFLFYLNLSNT